MTAAQYVALWTQGDALGWVAHVAVPVMVAAATTRVFLHMIRFR